MVYFRYYCPECELLTIHELRDGDNVHRVCTCCGFVETALSRSRAISELIAYERYLNSRETAHPEIGDLKRPGDRVCMPPDLHKGNGFA